jgi:hypothetical protein
MKLWHNHRWIDSPFPELDNDPVFDDELSEELGTFGYVLYKLIEAKWTDKAVQWMKQQHAQLGVLTGTQEALKIVKELQKLNGPDLCRALGGTVILDGEPKLRDPDYITTFTTDPDWYLQDDRIREETARCLYFWKYGTRPQGKPSQEWLRDADEFLSQARACRGVMEEVFSVHAMASA